MGGFGIIQWALQAAVGVLVQAMGLLQLAVHHSLGVVIPWLHVQVLVANGVGMTQAVIVLIIALFAAKT